MDDFNRNKLLPPVALTLLAVQFEEQDTAISKHSLSSLGDRFVLFLCRLPAGGTNESRRVFLGKVALCIGTAAFVAFLVRCDDLQELGFLGAVHQGKICHLVLGLPGGVRFSALCQNGRMAVGSFVARASLRPGVCDRVSSLLERRLNDSMSAGL